MIALAALPLALQAVAMFFDEVLFHRRRGLSRWERVGHPLDTLTVLACFAVAIAAPPVTRWLFAYVALSAFSCLFVTKDEWIHARDCSPAEHWLHAVLFVLHPIALAAVALEPPIVSSSSVPARRPSRLRTCRATLRSKGSRPNWLG